MKYYHIKFMAFEGLFAADLTRDEIRRVKAIQKTMSRDREYGSYSPEEQAKRGEVVKIVGSKVLEVESVFGEGLH